MLISSFQPLVGGAERQARQLAARLTGRGHRVAVITRRYSGLQPYEVLDGIDVHRVAAPGKRLVAGASYIIGAHRLLGRVHRSVDLIHCHQALSPATIGILGKFSWKKPVIVKVAGSEIRHLQRPGFGRLRLALLHQADVVVAPNLGVCELLGKLGVSRTQIQCIPNGVDTGCFFPISSAEKPRIRRELGLPEAGSIVIYAGRLHGVKGVDLLLKAWEQVGARHRTATLVIVGGGPMVDDVRDAEKRLANLVYVGPTDVVRAFLQASDVFVLPSRIEGLSNALLEAMACGLAVVGTDVAGNRQAIDSTDVGVLVRPEDSAALVEGICTLLSDPEICGSLGVSAREHVVRHFSLDNVVEAYLRLYASLAGGNGKRSG
jgi:glycosyltransferase involved in cell wall biosynthesis